MIHYILAFVLFLLYAYFEGMREAYYYHSAVKTGDSDTYNIHWVYLVQRGLFVASVAFLDESPFVTIALLSSMMLCFSFIHNGSYFSKRNDLNKDIYKKRWASKSFTSTSFFEFDFKSRTLQFIFGLIILAISIIFL